MSLILPQLGYHYYPDERHFTEQDWAIWGPRLSELGARWLTLKASLQRAIPESFLKSILEADIEPIIHIPAAVDEVQSADLRPLLTAYARWGIRYVVILDRPNLKSQWRTQTWSRKDLVERFLDTFLPILQAEQASGLIPVLPPLEPGGDYWDTAFLEGCLLALSRRGKESLLHGMALALYAWTYEHPLNWGAGGPQKWIETLPYSTPQGSQDQFGMGIFDWYEAISRKILGHPLPMLAIVGGPGPIFSPSETNSNAYSEQAISIYRAIEMGQFTPSLKAFCFHLLASDPAHPDHDAAWFPKSEKAFPVVSHFQQLRSSHSKLIQKFLSHYLLLPESLELSQVLNRENVSALIRESKPTLGFSPMEARLAHRVTIIGNEEEVPMAIEDELKNAGCFVERMAEPMNLEKNLTQNYLEYFISTFAGERHA